MKSGKSLNEQWGVNAEHALFRSSGDWYHHLKKFPGALFDLNGYVLFTTEQEYLDCPFLQIGKELHVPNGIACIPTYIEINDISHDIQLINNDFSITSTHKKQLIQSRIGQGCFRYKLIEFWRCCSVTNSKCISLLIASHIKPWKVSSNSERLDPFNGLLLLPNIDRAFDKGKISFSTNGEILISSNFSEFKEFGIDKLMTINLTVQHLPYFEYHRKHVYKE